VGYFKRLTGFDAIGVRLHDGDDFPFLISQGFPDGFLETENSICLRDAKGRLRKDKNGLPLLDCMCGKILSSRVKTDESSFTRFGSFFTNSTSDLSTSDARRKRLGVTRNICNRHGYESVALLPLHAYGKVLGLFQFNDHCRDRFTDGLIQQLENLVDYASLALANLESMEALRESEEKYRILVENASEAIFVLQDGYCIFCNPRTLEISGYSNHDVPRKGFLENIHPDDRRLVEKYLGEKQNGESVVDTIECRFVTRTGEIRWIDLSTAPITWMGKPAALNFMSDITERKSAQLELLNSEIKLQDLIDNLDGIVCAVDKNMKLMVFNREFHSVIETLYGYPPSVGDCVLEIVASNQEFSEKWRAIYSRVLSGEHMVLENEYEIAGQKRYDEITHIPIRNAGQEIVGMTIVVRNITEKKKAERERRALEERFFNAFHTSPDSISINTMREGIFIDVNQGFSAITGYLPAEVIGKSSLQVNLWDNPADREKLIAGIREKGEMINFEAKTRTKTGETKFCLMSARKIDVNGEDCVLMMTRDISDRKAAEARLNEQIEELRRWHAVTLGRETRIIDLKNEVNELLIKAGKPPRYIVSGES
jgi:PAS domain S-box-containing protein